MSTKNYMCILCSAGGECERSKGALSATDMEQMMAKYQAWQAKHADNYPDTESRADSFQA